MNTKMIKHNAVSNYIIHQKQTKQGNFIYLVVMHSLRSDSKSKTMNTQYCTTWSSKTKLIVCGNVTIDYGCFKICSLTEYYDPALP